jgi:mannitol/fructose-specific phosphotransferase system IIA component (Ntr-type)
MRLSEFVVREAILPQMDAANKEGVIRNMVASLHAAGQFPGADLDDIVRAVLKREELGSTGIGRGVAIPHAKHPCAQRLTGTIAVAPSGVDFKSIDGDKAFVFVLLVSPQDRPGDHLRALENVSRCLRDDNFVKSLRQSQSREEISRLLDQLDRSGS